MATGKGRVAPAASLGSRPIPWAVLEEAITSRRALSVRYHDLQRLICPHVLGWKAGRAKVVVYQVEPTVTRSGHSADPWQRWRSMFVEEIEHAVITDAPWRSADNYTPICNNIDDVVIEVNSTRLSRA
ncbi:MAG: hypothetical protein M0T80_00335 [Actinomycetota bacterium]|nr:hypothetical protein [Actinomycetota bacterium]